MEKVDPEST